jgi:hypothetical protein
LVIENINLRLSGLVKSLCMFVADVFMILINN